MKTDEICWKSKLLSLVVMKIDEFGGNENMSSMRTRNLVGITHQWVESSIVHQSFACLVYRIFNTYILLQVTQNKKVVWYLCTWWARIHDQ